MCISAGTAGLIAAGLSAATAIHTTEQSRKDASKARSAQLRAAADADAMAAQSANSRRAARRRALSAQSLATGADVMSTGTLAGGKPTLGG